MKIRNAHRSLKNDSLKNQAEFHHEKMFKNLRYAAYLPLLTTLAGLLPLFVTTLANFKLGGKDRTAAKNKIQNDIIATLDEITRQLETAANTPGVSQEEGESLIRDAGFIMWETKSGFSKREITFLSTPNDVRAIDEKKQGSVLVAYAGSADTTLYLIEVQQSENNWLLYACTDATEIVITGLPSKALSTLRITAGGPDNVMSDRSEPVTVWVT